MLTSKQLQEQIYELQVRLEETRKVEIRNAVTQVHSLIKEHSLCLEDIFPPGNGKIKKTEGASAVVKYRHPETNETWTGRGRLPKWLLGKNREDFLVAESTPTL